MSRLTLSVFLFLSGAASAIDWPSEPRDSAQPIGNGWGEYQDYGGSPYLHPGIDVMGYPGQPVYAVAPGYVKAVLTTYEDLHWRVAVGETSGPDECDGWLYAHLERFSITVQVGDWVSFTNMEVEEYRGTTFLQWYPVNNPGLTVVSSGNPIPPPIVVSVSDIPAPVYDPVRDGWFVVDVDRA